MKQDPPSPSIARRILAGLALIRIDPRAVWRRARAAMLRPLPEELAAQKSILAECQADIAVGKAALTDMIERTAEMAANHVKLTANLEEESRKLRLRLAILENLIPEPFGV